MGARERTRRQFALRELAHGVGEQLLFFGEVEVHLVIQLGQVIRRREHGAVRQPVTPPAPRTP